jgi:hypothetical protein
MKTAALFVFLFVYGAAFGQASRPFIGLKTGDRFQKEVRINSNAVIQEGTQVVDAGFRLVVSQVYTVEGLSAAGPVFGVRTTRVVDTVISAGKSHTYSSQLLQDPGSLIENKIRKIINTTYAAHAGTLQPINSTGNRELLLELAGLRDDYIYPHGTNPLLPIPFEAGFSVGYKWTQVDSIEGERRATTYTLVSRSGNQATLTFASKSEGSTANTNSIGSLVFDTDSRLVLERLTQSVTAGYIRVNGVLCATDRKTAISERMTKDF